MATTAFEIEDSELNVGPVALCAGRGGWGLVPVRPIKVNGLVAYVPLTHGAVALIDADDVERVGARRWQVQTRKGQTSYARSYVPGGGVLRLHRFIVGASPGQIVDHVNGDGLDNRKSNLRVASQRDNARNARIKREHSVGLKGVKRNGRGWMARVTVNRRTIHLGTFETSEEAHAAYCAAAAKYFGEFANFGA